LDGNCGNHKAPHEGWRHSAGHGGRPGVAVLLQQKACPGTRQGDDPPEQKTCPGHGCGGPQQVLHPERLVLSGCILPLAQESRSDQGKQETEQQQTSRD
jgi:hypothetical protein